MNVPTIVICLILLFLGIYSIKSYARKLSRGCCGAGGDAVKRHRVSDRNKSHYPYELTLYIGGMSCQNCAVRVENALNAIDGVWASVDLKKSQAVVRTKEEPDAALLCREVAAAGYRAERV